MRLGNIVHQAASVMGSSLWQWSSGHKSKRAHKHHMTDGWEDSFRQGGRDGEREIKWDRERKGEGQRCKRDLRLDCSVLWKVSGVRCFMNVHVQCQLGKENNRESQAKWFASDVWWETTKNESKSGLQTPSERADMGKSVQNAPEYKITFNRTFSWKHRERFISPSQLSERYFVSFSHSFHFVCLHVGYESGQLVGWKRLTSSAAQTVKRKERYERGVCLKAEHREKKVALEKKRMKRLLRRHLLRFEPAASKCQKISSKGCLALLRLWRVWQISTARWMSWPEEDDVF